jgi:RHH-type rel operon transcriptional repressor/antitoxin RelB
MLSLELPKNIEDRLDTIANSTGRTKQDCAAAAIVSFVESEEDYQVAVERLKRNQPGIPLEELDKKWLAADKRRSTRI